MFWIANSEFQPLSKCTTRGRKAEPLRLVGDERAVRPAAQTQHAIVLLASALTPDLGRELFEEAGPILRRR